MREYTDLEKQLVIEWYRRHLEEHCACSHISQMFCTLSGNHEPCNCSCHYE